MVGIELKVEIAHQQAHSGLVVLYTPSIGDLLDSRHVLDASYVTLTEKTGRKAHLLRGNS